MYKSNAKNESEKILVVGGAGYIGSHMVKELTINGYQVVVLDDLSSGFRNSVGKAELVIGSIADSQLLHQLFSANSFIAVIHFASFISVGESVIEPEKYYLNNVAATLNLIAAMRKAKIKNLIFSSTAAVYGNPVDIPINESHPTEPINPYGRSKLIVEKILEDFDSAYGFKSICLRYFNASGADPDGELGERHNPETHLIPLTLEVLSGRRQQLTIFGSNYETPDGTCIRDYVHVKDLCQAHLLALKRLVAGGSSCVCNLGYGTGYSVKEIIDTAVKITNRKINLKIEARRPGDPAILVANASKAKHELGWQPKFNNLDQIISSAWAWEKKYPWN